MGGFGCEHKILLQKHVQFLCKKLDIPFTGNEMGMIQSDMDVIILVWKYLHEMRNLHPKYEQNEMYFWCELE